MAFIVDNLFRKKYIDWERVQATQLDRCLSVFDLTALGVGSTLGLGLYVLAGSVAKSEAGPAVTLSFLIAALASMFAGLCYAEFGSRVPKAGSAYVYSYVTVGEFIGFIIGWNLILEYAIGTASVARGYSGYLDTLTGMAMSKAFKKVLPMHVSWLSEYPDFFAFSITFLLAVLLMVGVKESTRFNNLFTLVNLLVVLFVVGIGVFNLDFDNWNIDPDKIPSGVKGGKGGFLPFGFTGVMKGAATCFYGFVGFDCIATTGEEAKNPKKTIPLSIAMSLLIVFLSYFSISAVITLMLPYYDQSDNSPLPYVFEKVGMPTVKWVVTVGALAGLSTSLLGSMFPLPRIIYAMANDGLIFRWLAIIHPRLRTPWIATLLSGFLSAVVSAIFNLKELMNMMSIGTLLAYMLVACSVLILRYEHTLETSINVYRPLPADVSDHYWNDEADVSTPTFPSEPQISSNSESLVRSIFHVGGVDKPTLRSSRIATGTVVLLVAAIISLDCQLVFLKDQLLQKDVYVIVGVVVTSLLVFTCLLILRRQPETTRKVAFKVPWVPFIPALSIFSNVYLMLQLSMATWYRLIIWLSVGLGIYVTYGMWESSERYRQRGRTPPNDSDMFSDESEPLTSHSEQ